MQAAQNALNNSPVIKVLINGKHCSEKQQTAKLKPMFFWHFKFLLSILAEKNPPIALLGGTKP